MLYPVAEYFVSITGEGTKACYLAAFIRLRGCNLHCHYCDTRWANDKDGPAKMMSVEDILKLLERDKVSRVTLTGGEPLLQEDVGILIGRLGEKGYKVEVETNGSIPIGPFCSLPYRPVFTLDYKCPDSGMESHMITDNYHLLKSRDCVKFVVGSRKDLDRAFDISRKYHLAGICQVFLSPVFGSITPEYIVEYMKEHHWNTARLQLQLHKFIWPPDTRGV